MPGYAPSDPQPCRASHRLHRDRLRAKLYGSGTERSTRSVEGRASCNAPSPATSTTWSSPRSSHGLFFRRSSHPSLPSSCSCPVCSLRLLFLVLLFSSSCSLFFSFAPSFYSLPFLLFLLLISC